MRPKTRERWEATRAKGRHRFLLLKGALLLGVGYLGIGRLVGGYWREELTWGYALWILLSSVGIGYLLGWVVWLIMEHQYHKLQR